MRFGSETSLLALGAMLAAASPATAQSTGTPPALGSAREPNAAATTAEQDSPNDLATGNDRRAAVIAGEATATSSRDIVVTGTRIVRPNNRSAAPITTTTSAEIAAQGATTIEEVLNRLPQVQNNSEQNFSDSEGRQRIKLRSLGYERTLTLIDGMRFGIANTLDVGIIPNALVDRIDVLSGGASSVYGADAVSGVVNFILKKNFEGVRLDANYSFFNHDNRENAITAAARRFGVPVPLGMTNDGARKDITLTAGKNLFNDRVNITGFVNYRQSDLVQLRDRSTSACEVTQPTNTAPLSCTPSTFPAVGLVIPRSGARADQLLVNNPNGNRTFVPFGTVPAASANPYDEWAVQRPFERINAGGFVTAQIATNAELYGSGLYYRDKSSSPILSRLLSSVQFPGGAPYQVGCNNPFLSASQASDIGCPSLGSAAIVPIDVRYRFDGIGPLDVESINKGYRLVSGLRGKTGDRIWSYDISGMISRNQIDAEIGVPFPNRDRIGRALDVISVNGTPTCRSVVNGTDPGCVPFNAFIPNNSDRAAFDYIYGNGATPAQRTIARQLQFLGTISGDLGNYGIRSPWAEQGVAVALGAEYRDELLVVDRNAELIRQQGGQGGRFTQNILETNVEVQVPIVENRPFFDQLQVNGGYRLSKYNRLDGRFDTWKVEGLWAPIPDVTFRGSYNKAQAAAGVAALQSASNVIYSTGFYSDPCAPRINPANPSGARIAPIATIEQCRRTGLPDNLYNSASLICPDDACTVREGGFNLTPETAYTKTFGVVLRPRFLPGLTISVDRYLIDLEDQFDFFQPQNVLSDCLTTGDSFFCRGVVRNPGTFTLGSPPQGNPATGYVVRGSVNGFKSQAHGWDFQGQYNLGLGSVGRLDFGFNGSLTTRVGTQGSPTVASRDCVGYFGAGCGESLPRWAHQFRTTWTSADKVANVSLNWRHRGATPLTFYAPVDTGIPVQSPEARRDQYPGIKAYDWFDLTVGFDIAKQMTLRVTANNIFDRDPPIVPDSRATIGLLRTNSIMGYDLLGRQIAVGLSVRY
jgi:outer membrane receptor protein involved in Fe transport